MSSRADLASARCDLSMYDWYEGMAMEARMAATTMAMRISMRENPRAFAWHRQRRTEQCVFMGYLFPWLAFSRLAFLDPGEAAAHGPARRIDRSERALAAHGLGNHIRVGTGGHHRHAARAVQRDAADGLIIDVKEIVVRITEERIREGTPGGRIDRHGPAARICAHAFRERGGGRYRGIHEEGAVRQRGAEYDLFVHLL